MSVFNSRLGSSIAWALWTSGFLGGINYYFDEFKLSSFILNAVITGGFWYAFGFNLSKQLADKKQAALANEKS